MAKSVLITGTSTGIGRACAVRMAADGWRVYAGVRKDSDAAAVEAEIDGDVRAVILDVTDPEHVRRVVDQLHEELGPAGLDGLVNNAGVGEGGPFESLTDEDWQWHFDVNVFAVVRLTRETMPLLRAAKGRIVNIGSVAGRVATPMMSPYAAGKHAVTAISEALRFEVADLGLSVSCVDPGEVASAIWAKADERLEQMTVKLSPEIIERYDRHIDMFQGFLADGAKRGIPADRVATAVHHALTAGRPRHRYLVGPDAKLVGVISRFPDRTRSRAVRLNLWWWERSGRKLRRR